LKVTVANIL